VSESPEAGYTKQQRVAAGISAGSGVAFLCVAGLTLTSSVTLPQASLAAVSVTSAGVRGSTVSRQAPAFQAPAMARGQTVSRATAQPAGAQNTVEEVAVDSFAQQGEASSVEQVAPTVFSTASDKAQSGWASLLALGGLALVSIGSAAAALQKPPQKMAMMATFGKKKPAAKAAASAFDVEDLSGVTQPLGFWDPLQLSGKKAPERILWEREAEIKHGRVCMLAALGIITQELTHHPLFGAEFDGPATFAFTHDPLTYFWFFPVFLIGAGEIATVFKTFEDPSVATFVMKPGHQPGNLDFDPLGLKPEDEEEFKVLQTKEINNGRLAMISVLGIIFQELVTAQPVLPSLL
jgi:hypothetical protein